MREPRRETVAGSDRIDRPDAWGFHQSCAGVIGDEGTFRAEGNDNRTAATLAELGRGQAEVLHPGEQASFVFIRRKNRDGPQ